VLHSQEASVAARQCSAKYANLSYAFPKFFPMPPAKIVLETESRQCDLFGGPQVCLDFSDGLHFEPEYHVREAVLSFLSTCLHRDDCLSIDIGANIGQFSIMMAALGSRVIAVEGQIALATALQRSAEVNCFQDSLVVHNAYIDLDESKHGLRQYHDGSGGRPIMAGHPASTYHQQNEECCTKVFGEINTIAWKTLLLQSRNIDFIKIDIDSFEIDLMHQALDLISQGKINVSTFVVELRDPGFEFLQTLFAAGYHAYFLNIHLENRWIDPKGWDVYRNFTGSLYPAAFEERFAQRFMRYVIYIRPDVTREDFQSISDKLSKTGGAFEFLITKENLLERRFEYPYRKINTEGKTEFYTYGTNYGYEADESIYSA
jgi:FkbM family methyltransferase